MAKKRVATTIDPTDGISADEAAVAGAALAQRRDEAKAYYIVNPAGCVHGVTREHARRRLALGRGWRMATEAEIAELKRRKGHQEFDNPIAPRWSPEPDALPEVSREAAE